MKKMNQTSKVAALYGMPLATRRNMLSACVSLALAQVAAGTAWADSGYGADNLIGNKDNPGYNAGPVQRNADMEDARRTPSGQLYEIPRVTRETPSDGTVSGEVELGLMQSNDSKRYSKRNEYSDPQKSGILINNFSLSLENAQNAYFLNLNGGAPGRDDQFYNLSLGTYNDWKVKAFYNETPHVFSDTFKQYFTQNGNLMTPIATVAAAPAVATAMNLLPDTEIGLKRKKGGVRADLNLAEGWKVWGSVNREERKGARPFSIVGSIAVEGFEPIDQTTDDLGAGVSYSDKLTSFNLRATRSQFNNAISTINTWVNPALALAPANGITMDMPPDNEAYNVKADVTHKLPEFASSVLNASYSWGSSRQNDPMLQYIDPAIDPLNTQPNWNGTLGQTTSRATSNMRIDTQLFNLGWSLRPIEDLSVKASARRYETKNKSGQYYAYNPVTGQWSTGANAAAALPVGFGYSSTGLAGGPCQPAPGFAALPVGVAAGQCTGVAFAFNNMDMTSTPRDYKQDNYALTANYDIDEVSSLEGMIERENFSRTYRERDKTWENKWKLGYTNSALKDTTLRASFEQDSKRGSFYDSLGASNVMVKNWFAVYGVPYSRAALNNLILNAGAGAAANGIYPGLNAVKAAIIQSIRPLGGWQRMDQADRDQNILNARLNYQAQSNLDIGGMLQVRRSNYPSNANKGAQRDDMNTYNLDFNYQASAGWQINGFYTRQEGKQRSAENYSIGADTTVADAATGLITGYAPFACGLAPSAIVGVNLTAAQLANNLDCLRDNFVNPANAVIVNTMSNEDVLGFGLTKDFSGMLFGANYTYARGKTTIRHSYKAGLTTGVTAAQAAIDFPDITDERNSLDLSLLIPISKDVSTRLMYRYESFRVNDWHYYPTTIAAMADRGPVGFYVNTIGVLLNFKL